jgi:N-acetylneuraminate synthase
MLIGDKEVKEPFIIPDIGINHKGSLQEAKDHALAAYMRGAKIVKFQMHIPEEEMNEEEAKKCIPGNSDRSIWDIISENTLSIDEHYELKKYVEDELHMIHLCTPFSLKAAQILLCDFKETAIKIGSGENDNYEILNFVRKYPITLFVSLGMISEEAKSQTKDMLACSSETLKEVVYMHCVSNYSDPYDVRYLNLKRMTRLTVTNRYGFSSHCKDMLPDFLAMGMGATCIEKHFTKSTAIEGEDIPISMTPEELGYLVRCADSVSYILGDGKQGVQEVERVTAQFAKSTCYAKRDIRKGEPLVVEDIGLKRPANKGLSSDWYYRAFINPAFPVYYADQDYKKGDFIKCPE